MIGFVRTCRVCSCTDVKASQGGYWAEEDLCGVCSEKATFDRQGPGRLAIAGRLALLGVVLCLALMGVANAVRQLGAYLQ